MRRVRPARQRPSSPDELAVLLPRTGLVHTLPRCMGRVRGDKLALQDLLKKELKKIQCNALAVFRALSSLLYTIRILQWNVSK